MRSKLLAAVAGALLALVALAPTAASGSGNPFVGSWESFDDLPGDTSHVRMQLSPTGHMSLRDEAATGCGGDAATFLGTGSYDLTSEPQTFVAVGDLYCHTDQGRVLRFAGITLGSEYDPVGDVLIGTGPHRPCWSRTGTGDQSVCP